MKKALVVLSMMFMTMSYSQEIKFLKSVLQEKEK
jgi:hypothetical protein